MSPQCRKWTPEIKIFLGGMPPNPPRRTRLRRVVCLRHMAGLRHAKPPPFTKVWIRPWRRCSWKRAFRVPQCFRNVYIPCMLHLLTPFPLKPTWLNLNTRMIVDFSHASIVTFHFTLGKWIWNKTQRLFCVIQKKRTRDIICFLINSIFVTSK